MIHTLAKEYSWSKAEVDQVYPDEANVLVKFINHDKKNKNTIDKMDYLNNALLSLYIQHGDPTTMNKELMNKIQNVKDISSQIVHVERDSVDDEDLPDRTRLNSLKSFISEHRRS